MLFWSKRSTAPSVESRSDARAFSSRSLRSAAKSIRCSQSTAIVAPREAMFIGLLLLRRPSSRTDRHWRRFACWCSLFAYGCSARENTCPSLELSLPLHCPTLETRIIQRKQTVSRPGAPARSDRLRGRHRALGDHYL